MEPTFEIKELPIPGLCFVVTNGYFDMTLDSEQSVDKLIAVLGNPIGAMDRGHHMMFTWKEGIADAPALLNISFGIGKLMFSIAVPIEHIDAAKAYLANLFREVGILPIEEHERREAQGH